MKTFTKRIVINFIQIGLGAILLILITQVSSFSQNNSNDATKFLIKKTPMVIAMGFGTSLTPLSNTRMGLSTEKNKSIK